MFEPACRGGSKRSLNISNPTPKWPRSPGEMVSAPARAVDTHTHTHALTLTHTRIHAHAAGPRANRPATAAAAAAPLAWATRRFSLFFLIFNLPSLGFPPPRGRLTLPPAGSFRSCWVLLGTREGTPALLLRPGFSGERNPGPARWRRGPGVRRGAGMGRGPRYRSCGALCFPRGARGPRPGLRRPALLPAGRKLTPRSALNSELGSSPRHPSHSTWACAT